MIGYLNKFDTLKRFELCTKMEERQDRMMPERIVVHPFEDLRVEDYTGLKQAGEHAYAKLGGMIPWEKREEYMELGRNQVGYI